MRRCFFRLWVLIFWRCRFLPQGIKSSRKVSIDSKEEFIQNAPGIK